MIRVNVAGRVVAVFAPLYPPAFRGGGPIRSIAALVVSNPPDIQAVVLTSDQDLGARAPLPVRANEWLMSPAASGGGETYYATLKSPLRYWRALLEVRRRRPSVLHFNSFMNPRLTIVPLLLWRIGFWGSARILLAPRGEFGGGALSRRPAKKRLYMALFRALGFPRVTMWHSTAAHETEDIRRMWGQQALVIERGNDTLLSATAIPPEAVEGPLRTVFLGRIVEHKGLAIALRALANVTVPVHLDVYGSKEDESYASACESLATALPNHISVTFRGAVAPDNVVGVLAGYEVLLMPTAGENFGHVIAEALSASCVVLTTPETPWTARLLPDAGLILDRAPDAWSDAIQRLASEDVAQRLARREAASVAYETWTARAREPHVWTLAFEELAKADISHR